MIIIIIIVIIVVVVRTYSLAASPCQCDKFRGAGQSVGAVEGYQGLND